MVNKERYMIFYEIGEIVHTTYDYGIVIDQYGFEYQVAHEDGFDCYYETDQIEKVDDEDKKLVQKRPEYKKSYKTSFLFDYKIKIKRRYIFDKK
jgi:hypothetical protein